MLVLKLIRLIGWGSRSLLALAECSEGDWLGHTLAPGRNFLFLLSVDHGDERPGLIESVG